MWKRRLRFSGQSSEFPSDCGLLCQGGDYGGDVSAFFPAPVWLFPCLPYVKEVVFFREHCSICSYTSRAVVCGGGGGFRVFLHRHLEQESRLSFRLFCFSWGGGGVFVCCQLISID